MKNIKNFNHIVSTYTVLKFTYLNDLPVFKKNQYLLLYKFGMKKKLLTLVSTYLYEILDIYCC